MAVKRYAAVDQQNAAFGFHPLHYVCDTTAELPSSGLKLGDTALTKDTNAQYKAASATTWVSVLSASSATPFSKSVTFSDVTTVSPATVVVWQAPYACTLTAMKGYRVGGTGATVNAYRNTTPTNVRSSNLSITSAATWMDGGALQNTAFAVGDSLLFGLVTVTGSVTQVTIQLNFTRP